MNLNASVFSAVRKPFHRFSHVVAKAGLLAIATGVMLAAPAHAA